MMEALGIVGLLSFIVLMMRALDMIQSKIAWKQDMLNVSEALGQIEV